MYDLEYADDIVIHADNEYIIRKTINIVEKWCELNKMNLNKSKCGILRISKK